MTGIFHVLAKVDLSEAAKFIANLNTITKHHIGYCGTEESELYQTLTEDFIQGDMTTICVYSIDGTIQALIGLDIDEDSAEVWGPFSQLNDQTIQHQLWEYVKSTFPSISQYLFFVSEQNLTQIHFLKEIGAVKTGEHLLLEIERQHIEQVKTFQCRPYNKEDFEQFQVLHDSAFPNTYYDARKITELLQESQDYQLKVLASDGQIQGYAFYQMDVEERTAHLEYIAVDAKYRGQGLGTTLLKEVLVDIFSHPSVQVMTLTVNHTNAHANHVYFKAGFQQKHVLWSYRLR